MLLRFARSHQLRVRKRAPGRSMASYIWLETRFCRRDPWGHQGLSGRQAVPDVLAVPGFLSSLVFLSSLFLPAAIRDLLVTRPHGRGGGGGGGAGRRERGGGAGAAGLA